MKVSISNAIDAINEHGLLLVYPIKNRPRLPSLWSTFFPRTEMIWDWSAEGSDKVANLWHLRTEIAVSGEVVYTKWVSGRATFISKDLFVALLSCVLACELFLSDPAKEVYSALEDDSPQATKALREATGLAGKFYESAFQKALRELWRKLLIVGYGEVDEGGFPSLAVGATSLLFEELWDKASRLLPSCRDETIEKYLSGTSPFSSHFKRWASKLK